MEEIVFLILIGLISGTVSAFFGVGGGIVIIPILNFIYPELDQKFIIATSLAVIFINAIFNSVRFKKIYHLPIKSLSVIIVFTLVFSVLAAKIAEGLNTTILRLIFVAFISLVVLPLMFVDKEKVNFLPKNKKISSALIGIISGSISGFTGLGGGAVNVPLLYQLLHVDFKLTSFYSNVIMIFTAFSGFLTFSLMDAQTVSFQQWGYVLPFLAVYIVIGTYFGSKFGKFLHAKFDEKKLKLYFVLLLLFIIIRTTYLSISTL